MTVLEESPFDDTENPVCVICFVGKIKPLDNIMLYKNSTLLGSLGDFEKLRMKPSNRCAIRFNEIQGSIALRAVDTTNPNVPISFMRKENLDYDLKGIKYSSRLITIIDTPAAETSLDILIEKYKSILNEYGQRTYDILLSPFKGNRSDGKRRRRLDYATARAILEKAYNDGDQLALI